MFHREILLVMASAILASSFEIPPELIAYVQDIHNTCMEKSGTPENVYNSYDVKTNPHDPGMQCYFKCLMLESTWMSPEGEIKYDFIINSAHPELKDHLTEITSKCKNIEEGANLCEKASNFNYCLYQAAPDKWILI